MPKAGYGLVMMMLQVSIEAFEEQHTLCLYPRTFDNEPILRDKFQSMNITVFQVQKQRNQQLHHISIPGGFPHIGDPTP